MPRKTSNFDGVTRADERLGYALNSLRASIAGVSSNAGTTPGGVSYPIPYFPAQGGTTFYWQVDNSSVSAVPDPSDPTNPGSNIPIDDYNLGTDEDNEDGGAMVTWWLIPNDCATLGVHGRYVKKNGQYGRVIPWQFDDITDEERGMGFCERTLRGLRPGRVLDITRAVSISTSGAKAHNPVEPAKAATVAPQITAGATRDTSMQAWPNPVGGSPAIGYPPYGVSPHYPLYQNPALPATEGEALARLDLRNYALMKPRVVAVGSPIKEKDGVYYPVTFKYTAGLVDKLHLWLRRVGLKVSGTVDYKRYGKIKRYPLDELTDAERAAGTCVRNIGPFTRHQARQTWHIVRINAVDFRDEVQTKKLREWYPADPAAVAGFDHTSGLEATGGTLTYGAEQTGTVFSTTSGSYPSTGVPVPGAAASLSDADYDDLSGTQATDLVNAQGRWDGASFGAGARVLGVFRTVQAIAGKAGAVTIASGPDTTTEKDNDAYITFSANILDESGSASNASEVNATEAVFKFMRKEFWPGNAAYNANPGNYRQYLHTERVPLDGTDTKAEKTITGKKMGKRFVYIETVLRNAISRVRVDSAGNLVTVNSSSGAIVSGTTRLNFTAGRGANATYVGTNAHNGISSLQVTSATYDSGESNQGTAELQFNNIGVSVDGDGDALEGVTAVIPKTIFVYMNRRANEPPASVYAPATLAQAQNPSAASGWKLIKDVHVADEFEYARLATALQRQVHFPMRRKRQHWLCAAMMVKGSTTPVVCAAYTALSKSASDLPNDNYAHGNQNMVVGGTFLFSRQDFNVMTDPGDHKLGRHWYTAPTKNLGNYIDDSSTNPRWSPGNHCLRFIGSSGFTVSVTGYTLLKKALEPGGLLSASFLARNNGFATGIQVAMDVGKDSGGVFSPLSSGFTIAPSVSTAYRAGVLFGGQIEIDPSYSVGSTENLWLRITVTLSSPFGSNGVVDLDNIMVVRGNQLLSYDFSASEIDDLGNTATSSSFTDSSAASIDAGGGGKNPDFSGGEITL